MLTSQAPDGLEAVVAWRAWRVVRTPHGCRLWSVTQSLDWPVGEPVVARCPMDFGAHAAPSAGCRCGIHGARTAQDVTSYTAHHPASADRRIAVGLVSLWGDVVEGERGWRASHAYPRRILLVPQERVGPRHDDLVTALELADYGVPVEIHEGARKAITDEIVLDWHRAEWAAAVPTISSR
jgi:hypothetical protein